LSKGLNMCYYLLIQSNIVQTLFMRIVRMMRGGLSAGCRDKSNLYRHFLLKRERPRLIITLSACWGSRFYGEKEALACVAKKAIDGWNVFWHSGKHAA